FEETPEGHTEFTEHVGYFQLAVGRDELWGLVTAVDVGRSGLAIENDYDRHASIEVFTHLAKDTIPFVIGRTHFKNQCLHDGQIAGGGNGATRQTGEAVIRNIGPTNRIRVAVCDNARVVGHGPSKPVVFGVVCHNAANLEAYITVKRIRGIQEDDPPSD